MEEPGSKDQSSVVDLTNLVGCEDRNRGGDGGYLQKSSDHWGRGPFLWLRTLFTSQLTGTVAWDIEIIPVGLIFYDWQCMTQDPFKVHSISVLTAETLLVDYGRKGRSLFVGCRGGSILLQQNLWWQQWYPFTHGITVNCEISFRPGLGLQLSYKTSKHVFKSKKQTFCFVWYIVFK